MIKKSLDTLSADQIEDSKRTMKQSRLALFYVFPYLWPIGKIFVIS